MERKEGGGVPYARKEAYEYDGNQYEADLQNGDKVTIMDEGAVEESGNFGPAFYATVKTRNGEKRAKISQPSINVLIDAYGPDSASWVGKEVNVLTLKGTWGGNKGIACYFVTDGYYLDDYGELTNGPQGITANTGSADPVPAKVAEAQAEEPLPNPF
mgnify:CR=1 FL=1